MEFHVEGLQCSVCHAYLFDDDDIVFCPECGAPHHRDCFHSAGKCGLSDLHGTPGQFNTAALHREEPQPEAEAETAPPEGNTPKCQFCGEELSEEDRNCPNCGAPNFSRNPNMRNFDFLGGAQKEDPVAEDVTADEAKSFVRSNSQYYVPRFVQFHQGRKASWNWAAFLFPEAWFFSRKMIFGGVLLSLMNALFQLMSLPYSITLKSLPTVEESTRSMILSAGTLDPLLEHIRDFTPLTLILLALSLLLGLGLRIFCGLRANHIYHRYTLDNIRRIRSETEEEERIARYAKKGGISLILLLVGLMIGNYLPGIFAMFLN